MKKFLLLALTSAFFVTFSFAQDSTKTHKMVKHHKHMMKKGMKTGDKPAEKKM